MLITMPSLTIKHETWVPSRSFRGKINLVSAYQGRSHASTKITQNEWACFGLPLQMSSPQLGSFLLPAPCLTVHLPANRHVHQSTSCLHSQEPGKPRARYRAEPAGTVQPSPTAVAAVSNRQELSGSLTNRHQDLTNCQQGSPAVLF